MAEEGSHVDEIEPALEVDAARLLVRVEAVDAHRRLQEVDSAAVDVGDPDALGRHAAHEVPREASVPARELENSLESIERSARRIHRVLDREERLASGLEVFEPVAA